MRQRIMEQRRVEIIRRIQNPIRLLWQSEKLDRLALAKFILDFQKETALRIPNGAGAAQMRDAELRQSRTVGQGAAPQTRLEHVDDHFPLLRFVLGKSSTPVV